MPKQSRTKSLALHRRRPPDFERALAKLGIRTADVWAKPHITPQLTDMRRMLHNVSYMTQTDLNLPDSIFDVLEASDDPDAKKILEKYNSIPLDYRTRLDIEPFCVAAGVDPLRALEIIVSTIVRLNHNLSEVMASVASPKVVSKTIEMALTDDGTKDRELLHKATGFIPTPRGGPSVRVNVTQAQSQAATAAADAIAITPPRPEETIQRLVDRFNDRRPQAIPQVIEVAPSPAVEEDEDG